MGDFRKKIPCKPISKENISRKKIATLKKKKSFMVYNSGKKSYTCVCQRKKFYHQRFGKQIIAQSKSLIVPFLPTLKGQMVRTFLSARSAHNVFIVMSLPA